MLKQRRSKQTEGNIVAAASRLFAEKGYSEITMQDIADAAGIGKATLYYHTQGKEELGLAILQSRLEEFIREATVVSTDPGPAVERLRSMMDTLIVWLTSGPGVRDFFTAQVAHPPARLMKRLNKFRRRYLELLERVVSEGVASGELRNDLDPGVSAGAMMGIVIYFHMLAKVFDDPIRVADVRAKLVDLALNGLVARGDAR